MKTPDSPLTMYKSSYRPFSTRFTRWIGLLSAIGLWLGSCSVSDSFELNGHVDGLQEGDSVFLLVMAPAGPDDGPDDGQEVLSAIGMVYEDTLVTTASEGRFSFAGRVDAVREARLVFQQLNPRAPTTSFFLEPGTITVTGHLDNAYEIAVRGTPDNDILTAHKENEQQLYAGLKPNQGDSIHLRDYRGKYVLIDFWASWCVPCRAEHPYLRDVYSRFQDRGFEILGVSLDDDRDRWVEAIAKDQLSWSNVSELKGFGGPIARLYGVQPIPDNFLVDPDGIIVARRLRGDRLGETLVQFLGE